MRLVPIALVTLALAPALAPLPAAATHAEVARGFAGTLPFTIEVVWEPARERWDVDVRLHVCEAPGVDGPLAFERSFEIGSWSSWTADYFSLTGGSYGYDLESVEENSITGPILEWSYEFDNWGNFVMGTGTYAPDGGAPLPLVAYEDLSPGCE